MRKSVYLLSLAAVLMGSAACSSQTGNTDKPGSADPAPQNPPAVQEPVELVVYSHSGNTEQAFNSQYGDAIRAKYPHITLKYVRKTGSMTIIELLASGEQVDLYFDSIGNFSNILIRNKLEYDMTDLIKQKGVDLGAFDPKLIDAVREVSDGKLYGLPVFNNTLALFYNKDLFDRFGVAYPTDGMTWGAAVDVGRKMTRFEGQTQYLGLSVALKQFIRINPYSKPLVDPKTDRPTIRDEAWADLLQQAYAAPAMDDGYRTAMKTAIPPRRNLNQDHFLAMHVYLADLPTSDEAHMKKMNWDMVAMPTFEKQPKVGAQPYPTFFSIPVTSKHREAAMDVIAYLVSEEYQTAMARKGIMPSLASGNIREQLGQETEFKGKNLQAVYYNEFAAPAPKTIYDYAVEDAYIKNLPKLAKGEMDINTLTRIAEEEALVLIETVKKEIGPSTK